jgi:hypothetical protein
MGALLLLMSLLLRMMRWQKLQLHSPPPLAISCHLLALRLLLLLRWWTQRLL